MRATQILMGVAALGVLGTGCSVLTSVDGLTGGEAGSGVTSADGGRDGAIADGGVKPGDAATPGEDTGPIGSVEGGADTAPPLGYCATLSPAPLFCCDFDSPNPLAAWGAVGSHNGTATVSPSAFLSSPNGLLVSTSVLSSGYVDAAVYKNFSALAGQSGVMTFAFDMYLDKIDTTHATELVLGAFDLKTASGDLYELQLDMRVANGVLSPYFAEYWELNNAATTGYKEHVMAASFATKAWRRVAIELTLTTPGGGSVGNAARILVDGTMAAGAAINVTVANGTPQLVGGVSYVAVPSEAWLVHYDNMTFTTK